MPYDFLDGGMTLPGWSVMFILPAISVAALGVERHFCWWQNGLQASHVAVGDHRSDRGGDVVE